MTTDLSNKSVEELAAYFGQIYDQACNSIVAFDELARRLEEAQQKIVAQQAELMRLGYVGSAIPMSILAANNAKIAAEALECAANRNGESAVVLKFELRAMAAEYRAKAGRKE